MVPVFQQPWEHRTRGPSLSRGRRGVFTRDGTLNLVLRGKRLCRELEREETGETTIKAERTGRIQRERAENGPVSGSRRSDAEGAWRSRWIKSRRILSQVTMGVFIGAVVKDPDLLK